MQKTIGPILLTVMLALSVGLTGCGREEVPEIMEYELIISSTNGGYVSGPGEAAFTYDEGTEVSLVAEAEEGYRFRNWTGDVSTVASVDSASTTITMSGDYSVTASFEEIDADPVAIWDWYDLDTIRDNLNGSYLLMNDLDSTTAGYQELASASANQGKGWQPIGTGGDRFAGIFDGQGHEIRDLFIDRPDEDLVGLFLCVGLRGVIEDIGLVDIDVAGKLQGGGLVGTNLGTVSDSYSTGSVTGGYAVGGLVGKNLGAVSNSYSSGSVTGSSHVGGLVGWNDDGTVSNSYSTGRVTGSSDVGGLVGDNDGAVSDSYSTGSVTGSLSVGGLVGWNYDGTVSNSYSTGSVTGSSDVGGLVGNNHGTVSNSYSTGSVTGSSDVGGLVGDNNGTVSNSYYNHDEVLINGENMITIGALLDEDFDQWLANDKFLDVNERLSKENGYYLINNASDFKQLLAFGQDGSLRFRLKDDLDLANDPNFCIPYLAGEFDGNGHRISNLSFNFDSIAQVGLFGYLASGGKVSRVGVENVNMTAASRVGGLVGWNHGTVSNSYSTGSVTGSSLVGGLVGVNYDGTVRNSYSTGSVTGSWYVGGLVGWNDGTVRNSYSTGSVAGDLHVGGLVGDNDGTVSNSCSTGSVTGSSCVGGLVGENHGTVSDSFWDTETSERSTSDGGTGKTTAEMQDITTFSDATWGIVAVANPGERNPSYIWNIVDGQTYPFLGWQSVS